MPLRAFSSSTPRRGDTITLHFRFRFPVLMTPHVLLLLLFFSRKESEDQREECRTGESQHPVLLIGALWPPHFPVNRRDSNHTTRSRSFGYTRTELTLPVVVGAILALSSLLAHTGQKGTRTIETGIGHDIALTKPLVFFFCPLKILWPKKKGREGEGSQVTFSSLFPNF